jgi:hypothetical protein
MSLKSTMRDLLAAGVVCLSVWLAPSGARVLAVDFIRGDANGDGVVSLADALMVYQNQFLGFGSIPCPDAADANDDESVDIVDIVTIYALIVEGTPLPAPFPQIGPDSTGAAGGQSIDCPAYGGDGPVDDPLSRLEVIDAVADGGNNARTDVVLAVTCRVPLYGVSGKLRFEPGTVTSAGDAASLVTGVGLVGMLSGDVYSFILTPGDPHTAQRIPAGLSIPLLRLQICLASGTAAGAHPVILEVAELVDEEVRSIHPRSLNGVLEVLADVTVSEDCGTPPPPPPPPVNVSYRLEAGNAAPGGEASVHFSIRADAEVQAYAASIDFDEEVLEAISIEEVWRRSDGLDLGFKSYEISNRNETPGNGGIDEGFLIAVAVFDLHEPLMIPANVDNEMLRFRFRVRADATVQSTQLQFIDGAKGKGQPVPNRVAANGNNVYTKENAASFIFISNPIGILPDVITFVRADSNGDGGVDLSDPLATLGWLFLGEKPVACLDAADANDDGRIDIADPLSTLDYLFLGRGTVPPAPFPAAGLDPTEDGMGCLYGSSP